MIKIAVDAMGGDNAPSEIVKGAVEATNENKDIFNKIINLDKISDNKKYERTAVWN